MYYYKSRLAGVETTFAFHHEKTVAFYRGTLQPCEPCSTCIVVPPESIEHWQRHWSITDPAYVECLLSCHYACDALMHARRVVFHGASFLWRGRAFIFSAPSGTGKTTQLKLWKENFGTEIEIMNGDRPILEVLDSGGVLVHPSPWKGKENMGRDDLTAPLGGIIVLRQDRSNRMERMKCSDACRNLFSRIYSTFNTEGDVLRAAEIMDRILRSTPVWLLRNLGDRDSAMLTYRTLLDEGAVGDV